MKISSQELCNRIGVMVTSVIVLFSVHGFLQAAVWLNVESVVCRWDSCEAYAGTTPTGLNGLIAARLSYANAARLAKDGGRGWGHRPTPKTFMHVAGVTLIAPHRQINAVSLFIVLCFAVIVWLKYRRLDLRNGRSVSLHIGTLLVAPIVLWWLLLPGSRAGATSPSRETMPYIWLIALAVLHMLVPLYQQTMKMFRQTEVIEHCSRCGYQVHSCERCPECGLNASERSRLGTWQLERLVRLLYTRRVAWLFLLPAIGGGASSALTDWPIPLRAIWNWTVRLPETAVWPWSQAPINVVVLTHAGTPVWWETRDAINVGMSLQIDRASFPSRYAGGAQIVATLRVDKNSQNSIVELGSRFPEVVTTLGFGPFDRPQWTTGLVRIREDGTAANTGTIGRFGDRGGCDVLVLNELVIAGGVLTQNVDTPYEYFRLTGALRAAVERCISQANWRIVDSPP